MKQSGRIGAILGRISDAIDRVVDSAHRVRLWPVLVGGWRMVVAIVVVELILLSSAVTRLTGADPPDALFPVVALVGIPLILAGYARYRRRQIAGPPQVGPYTGGIREYIPNNVRFQVLQRDGFRCRYCGRTPQDGAKLEIDHIHPVSKGGATHPDNLITACFDCNRSKGARRIIDT